MAPLLKSKFKKEPVASQFPAKMVVVPIVDTKPLPVSPRTIKEFRIPESLKLLWTQFKRPPLWWNGVGIQSQLNQMIER